MASLFRYAILSISLLCMSFLIANTVLFHFTVICMEPGDNAVNGTSSFTPLQESWILSALAVGRLAGTLPAISMMNHCGLRVTFTAFGMASGIATLLMPLASSEFYYVLAVRFLQGFGVCSVYVAIGIIPVVWGGNKEKGMFVSLLTCSYQLAPFLTMPISGYFCSSSFGWPGVYYLFGTSTIMTFAIFFLVYSNSPHRNRLSPSKFPITEPEDLTEKKPSVPYKSIFSTPSTWGVWMTALGDALGYQVFILYGPIYINKVLHFEVAKTGILAAIPYLLSILTKFVGGLFIDKASCCQDHPKIITFTSVCQAMMTACFVALTLISEDTPLLAQAIFTMTIVFSGLHCVGLMSGSQIVAQQYNHILTSVIALENGLVVLFLPTLVAVIAPHHGNAEWATVFYYIVGVLIVTNLTFVILTKGRQFARELVNISGQGHILCPPALKMAPIYT
uniref:MFS domain-containing protein n=1 Tax=Steinernema glaseri TaxID=37863 RepID=A0A1I8AGK4_9BILA